MSYPSIDKVNQLFEQMSVVPLVKTIEFREVSPITLYEGFCDRKNSFILESSDKNDRNIRYSIIGLTGFAVFESHNNKNQITKGDQTKTIEGNPLDILKEFLKNYKGSYLENVPEFYGGAVGFLGYDIVRNIENIGGSIPDNLQLPDCRFVITKELIVIDHLNKKMNIIINLFKDEDIEVEYEKAILRIESILEKVLNSFNTSYEYKKSDLGLNKDKFTTFSANMKKRDYIKKVNKAKEYIFQGEIFQVVLSQRFHTDYNEHPFHIYKSLSQVNPSPYMFYINFGEYVLLGSSPEMLVKVNKGIVETYPIAGTRIRGKTDEQDTANEEELLANEKENAEHIMLVDLARNDVGRVCRFGSVKVEQLAKIQRFSHVMHIVSKVIGLLDRDKDCFDVIKSCLPAGTVSGAPKIRAMQIINELEMEKRGPYAGAIGYFSFTGDMDTCITIRSVFVKDKKAYIQAGAGIVMDSVPEDEYSETVNKAKALMQSICRKGEIKIDIDN